MFKIIVVIVAVFVGEKSVYCFGECVTPGFVDGECNYLRHCPSLFVILKRNPLSNNDREYLKKSQCGWFREQPLVCCPFQKVVRPTFPPSQAPDYPKVNDEHTDLLPAIGECGKNPADDRIFGGTVTAIDEFPWTVLLQYAKPLRRPGFHCGGSLISNRYVVTASHCVNGRDIPASWNLFSVRLGEWDLTAEKDCTFVENREKDCSDPPIDVAIEEKIPHPKYNPQSRNQHHDIALLRLQRTVQFTDFVIPICLPRFENLQNTKLESVSLDVAGWGKTEILSQSNVKLKARVNIYNWDECRVIYGRQNATLGKGQICAGGKRGVDSCRGDSGGPLMTTGMRNRQFYWYLVGIVSFGPSPCGLENFPAVYTNVETYVDWIQSTLKP